MPSSSARCAQLPRAADKVPFYAALKKFRDYLKGLIPHIDEAECIFTEERIKQQCEQVNFKSHQNETNLTGESYSNAVGASNNESLLQNSSGYPFDRETNSRGAAEGAGAPGIRSSESFMMSSLVGSQQEKKKRGRPKKIRGPGIIDPVTGNKIQVNSQLQSHGADFANILNLSMVQGASCEMPKKKRGRPKKVKPQPTQLEILGQQNTQSSIHTQKSNIMSIQAMTGDITQESSLRQHRTLQTKHQHVSALYSTPPHQRSLYSPMASPSLNCSYVTNTPPSQPHHDKLGIGGNIREDVNTNSIDLVQSNHHQLSEQNLGETPPPSSPNICPVDFEPQAAASTGSSSIADDRADTELSVMRLQNTHQRSRYNSPINSGVTSDHNTSENIQYWLSPQHNHIQSPAATTAVFSTSPQQQSSLHYHEQQQIQSLQQYQELHAQWPLRHQNRYEDVANSHYMINSPQLHHAHTHHNDLTNHHQNQHTGSDVARKSLSGLETLVDQIPTISECESVVLSSTAAINAQAAAAAAVESRLAEMRYSFNDSQLPDSQFVNFTTTSNHRITSKNPTTSVSSNNNQSQQSIGHNNLLSSNFSVRNLAASSASSNSTNNHESYDIAANARPPAHTNIYHHSNLMAAAVLAAAAAKSPNNLSSPTSTSATVAYHAQMYMDPHAHLTTHVPVNSLYPPPTSHHHPATGAHHSAAAHHHAAAQHTAADYANNPYATAQSNINATHTLHMPSPNYPYGYATASSQSNYNGYPHSHPPHHGHPHAHHTTHHLTMFDRLKPSAIGGYSGF